MSINYVINFRALNAVYDYFIGQNVRQRFQVLNNVAFTERKNNIIINIFYSYDKKMKTYNVYDQWLTSNILRYCLINFERYEYDVRKTKSIRIIIYRLNMVYKNRPGCVRSVHLPRALNKNIYKCTQGLSRVFNKLSEILV